MKLNDMTPLTSEEQDFAAKNHDIILTFLKWRKLNPLDWYDVAALGYIKAVIQWFINQELHVYNFKTIAYNTMRSSVGNEYRKLKTLKKYETYFNLNDTLNDNTDFTFLDMITDSFNQFEAIETQEELHERFNNIAPSEKPVIIRKLKNYFRRINPDLREDLYTIITGQRVY